MSKKLQQKDCEVIWSWSFSKTNAELAEYFGLREDTISKHINGRCSHDSKLERLLREYGAARITLPSTEINIRLSNQE